MHGHHSGPLAMNHKTSTPCPPDEKCKIHTKYTKTEETMKPDGRKRIGKKACSLAYKFRKQWSINVVERLTLEVNPSLVDIHISSK